MSSIHLVSIPSMLSLLASPLLAIEAPPDDAPPPADPTAAASPADEVAPHEDAPAYLGVVAEKIPEMLASQLALKDGEGIVLRAVMPDSPAAEAGLEVHDVITRISGEAVASSEDLTAAIAEMKPGQAVELDLIRGGKEQKIEAKLAPRPAHMAGGAPIQPMDLNQLNLDGIPAPFADRVRKMLEQNLAQPMFDLKLDEGGMVPGMGDALQLELGDALGELKIHGHDGFLMKQAMTIHLMDEEGSIEVKSNDGGKVITLRDNGGNVTWTGPWDTEQDKAAVPDEIRERIEKLNIDADGQGMRFDLQLDR